MSQKATQSCARRASADASITTRSTFVAIRAVASTCGSGARARRRHTGLPGSDTEAFDAGIASITPLSLDLWARDAGDVVGRILSDLV